MSESLPPLARKLLAGAMADIQRASGGYYLRVLGDPILHQPTIPVKQMEDLDRELLPAMMRILEKTKGVGVAAPQVGSSWRLAIVRLTTHNREVSVLINPTIIERSPEIDVKVMEGCLSVPTNAAGTEFFRTSTRRHQWVVVEHSQFHVGSEQRHRLRLEGFDAQIVQHEVDHLDGNCIFTNLPRQQRRAAERAVRPYLMAHGRLEREK